MTQPTSGEDGFTLFEAIIAVAIAALALAALYRSVGVSVRATAAVRTKQAALALVRSQLDAVGSDGVLQSGTSTGHYPNGLGWRQTVLALSRPTTVIPVQSYWVVVEGLDRQGRPIVRLETAKMAREAQP